MFQHFTSGINNYVRRTKAISRYSVIVVAMCACESKNVRSHIHYE